MEGEPYYPRESYRTSPEKMLEIFDDANTDIEVEYEQGLVNTPNKNSIFSGSERKTFGESEEQVFGPNQNRPSSMKGKYGMMSDSKSAVQGIGMHLR